MYFSQNLHSLICKHQEPSDRWRRRAIMATTATDNYEDTQRMQRRNTATREESWWRWDLSSYMIPSPKEKHLKSCLLVILWTEHEFTLSTNLHHFVQCIYMEVGPCSSYIVQTRWIFTGCLPVTMCDMIHRGTRHASILFTIPGDFNHVTMDNYFLFPKLCLSNCWLTNYVLMGINEVFFFFEFTAAG